MHYGLGFVVHGVVEGGADFAAVGVDVEARGEEEGDDGFLPEADGEVERGAVEGVGVGRVGTGGGPYWAAQWRAGLSVQDRWG